MSCLSVNINIIPSKFEVGTTLLNKLNVNITNISNGLVILLNKINEDLKLNISDIYQKHLTVSYGIVCSIKTENYLQVSPEDVQWITEYSDIIYIVKSNTDWKIITE